MTGSCAIRKNNFERTVEEKSDYMDPRNCSGITSSSQKQGEEELALKPVNEILL